MSRNAGRWSVESTKLACCATPLRMSSNRTDWTRGRTSAQKKTMTTTTTSTTTSKTTTTDAITRDCVATGCAVDDRRCLIGQSTSPPITISLAAPTTELTGFRLDDSIVDVDTVAHSTRALHIAHLSHRPVAAASPAQLPGQRRLGERARLVMLGRSQSVAIRRDVDVDVDVDVGVDVGVKSGQKQHQQEADAAPKVVGAEDRVDSAELSPSGKTGGSSPAAGSSPGPSRPWNLALGDPQRDRQLPSPVGVGWSARLLGLADVDEAGCGESRQLFGDLVDAYRQILVGLGENTQRQ
ncbi:unnamed protein product, partial [Protopolystoma xenopodis]